MRNYKLPFLGVLITMTVIACNNDRAKNAAGIAKHDTVTVIKKDTTHLLGMWLDEDIKTEKGEQVAYQIVSQGKNNFIQVITFKDKKLNVNDNPEIGPSASAIKKTANNRYVGANDASDIYVIEKTGNLLIYDQSGFIAKCKKLL